MQPVQQWQDQWGTPPTAQGAAQGRGLAARSHVCSPKGTLPAEPLAHLQCHRAPPSRSAQSSSCQKEGHWWGWGGQKGKRPISSRLHFPQHARRARGHCDRPWSAAHRGGSWGEFLGDPHPGLEEFKAAYTSCRRHRRNLLEEGDRASIITLLILQMEHPSLRVGRRLAQSHTAFAALPCGEKNSLPCPGKDSL